MGTNGSQMGMGVTLLGLNGSRELFLGIKYCKLARFSYMRVEFVTI